MATLSAMFKLYDRYSTTITTIMQKTDRATQSILGASKKTDGFNDSLKRTDAAATKASGGIGKLIGTIGGLAAVKKTMDMTDTYMSTNARLSMITDSLEEQKRLQQDIFAAANRSRGNYVEMANAAAKLKMLAGDSFGSNQEAVGFTELLTKSLKISGAGQAEQNSAFLQLTQAMTSGRLQGDEFRSVMENAPMVADAIAKYMGKSKGELKELSSQGVITSDIIKNAIFEAAGDINRNFAKMPMTFGDIWNRVKNEGIRAFGGVYEKVNAMLNSDMGQAAINNLVGLFYFAGDAAEWFIDLISNNWPLINTLIWISVAGMSTYFAVTKGMAAVNAVIHGASAAWGVLSMAVGILTGNTAAASAAQFLYNGTLLACPITWVVLGIMALVGVLYIGTAAFNHFAGTSVSATGLIGAAFATAGAYIFNTFIYPLWNGFSMLANFIGNACFNDATAAVKVLFLDMANSCVGYILNMARAIESIINKIPGVTVDITSGLDSYKSGLENRISTIKSESGWKEYVKQPELMDYTKAASAGYEKGSSLASKASGFLSGFVPEISGSDIDFSQFATGGNPATVKGTGKGGAVKVESEEDLEWMRKLAERDYVARISQNTLAPNIRVEFTGPITKEADVDGVAAHMAEQLKEIIATAPEGVYP